MLAAILTVVFWAAEATDVTADARWPDVRLADAAEFNASSAVAHECWHQAGRHIRHCEDRIKAHYPFAAYQQWAAEAHAGLRAWRALDDALDPAFFGDREYRLELLDRLRREIGDGAYRARRMPPPCPGHLFE